MPLETQDPRLLEAVAALARKAGSFLRTERPSLRPEDIESKTPRDFVSRADRNSQEILQDELELLTGSHGVVFVGEEGGDPD
ncbi:hypothetical protein GF324_06715, partial [bacterium]|nr:hypothetical protein [bacterium]